MAIGILRKSWFTYQGSDMPALQFFLGVSRAPFLTLTLSVLFLALALVLRQTGELSLSLLVLVLLAGLSAHVAVNALNEFHDFKSGLDLNTKRTPFSGGSGTLPLQPEWSLITLVFAFACLLLCIAIGLYFVLVVNSFLIFPGVLGVVIVLTYTPWINQNPWLCLIAPGTGFGFVMLPGAVLALGGTLNTAVYLVAASIFFLTNNLLLLNQLPDIDADRNAGRRTLPIALGYGKSLIVAALFYAATYIPVIVALKMAIWPLFSSWVVLLLPLAIFTVNTLGRAKNTSVPVSALAANVLFCLIFPVFLGVAILAA